MNEEQMQAAGNPTGGALTQPERAKLMDELKEMTGNQIEDMAMPLSLIVGGLTIVLLARFSVMAAMVVGVIVGAMVFRVKKASLEQKHLLPIADYSDQMLQLRYQQAILKHLGAQRKSNFVRAVVVGVGILVAIVWIVGRAQR